MCVFLCNYEYDPLEKCNFVVYCVNHNIKLNWIKLNWIPPSHYYKKSLSATQDHLKYQDTDVRLCCLLYNVFQWCLEQVWKLAADLLVPACWHTVLLQVVMLLVCLSRLSPLTAWGSTGTAGLYPQMSCPWNVLLCEPSKIKSWELIVFISHVDLHLFGDGPAILLSQMMVFHK